MKRHAALQRLFSQQVLEVFWIAVEREVQDEFPKLNWRAE